MTKLPAIFTLAACSLLALGCATEEGYTPIGEDREDKGGGLFYLSAENPSSTVYFSCDDVVACDLQLNVALTASEPNLLSMEGEEALHATLISPSGTDDKSETMVIGLQDSIGSDNALEWSYTYEAIPPGDYSIDLDLGVLDGASIRIGTIEL
jgi:hypothetical protein